MNNGVKKVNRFKLLRKPKIKYNIDPAKIDKRLTKQIKYKKIQKRQNKVMQLQESKVKFKAGMRGFFCTCNFREKECIKDTYKLLQQYSEIIMAENDKNAESNISNNKGCNKKEDISKSLNKEINLLQNETSTFQAVDTNIKNLIFFESKIQNPEVLVSKVIHDLNETKMQCSRFILRLLPVQGSCRAYLSDMKALANKLFEKYFSQEPKTFCIVYSHRCNDTVKREEVITDFANIICKKNPGNKVNLKNPEIAVIVEILRSFCLISIAPDYFKYKKYNLIELCKTKKEESQQDAADVK